MRKISLTLLLLFFLPSISFAQVFSIEDLRIEGLQRVSAGSVFAAVPVQVGDLADESVIQDTIRSLFKTGFFDDIAVFRDGNVLVIQVSERPAISEINLEGNKVIKDEDLLRSLRDNGLSEGQIFKPATLDGLSKSLSREYVSQGHYGSVIETEIRELPRNRIAIDINVDEGKKAKIKEINLVGNEAYSSKKLMDLFESSTSGWFTWITGKDKYSREKLSGDLESLESYYLDRGYLQFRIDSTQVSVSPDKLSVYITVNLDEGDVYTVGEAGLLGDLILPEEQLTPFILLKEGQTFSQALVTSTKEIITTRLSNEGYTFAEVNEIIDIDEDNKTANLTFFVDPQQRTYVRRIEFRGNTRTEGEVLRREMRQVESSVASNQLIEFGKLRLDRLGFFKEVESETVPVAGTSDQVDVIYTVEEQNSGSISASLGYAQNTGAIIGFNLQENNFLGTGNSVGIGINRSRFQESLNLSYTDPYFTEDGVSAGYSVFARNTDFGNFQVASYTTDVLGLRVNYGYPLSEVSRISFGFGYENMKVDVGDRASDEIENFAPEDSTFNQFKVQVGWSRSTLNRGIFATRGTQQSLLLDSAIPGSDAPFLKVSYNGQRFLPIYGPWIMRFSTELGWGQSLDSGRRLPFFENYYAGGFGSIRGFEQNTLGPRESPAFTVDELGDIRPLDDADPIGGNVLVTGSAELILPLPFLPDQRSVRATLFMDAGNVFDTDCGARQNFCYKPDVGELRYSYGVSVTWLSGFGPMSFALGQTANGQDEFIDDDGFQIRGEEREFFQFSLGQTF